MKGNKVIKRNTVWNVLFYLGALCLPISTVILELTVINLPKWICIAACLLPLPLLIRMLAESKSKLVLKILLTVLFAAVYIAVSLFPFVFPYWNSYSFKKYRGVTLNYDDVISYSDAKDDLDKTVYYLQTTHPLFINGLTDDITEQYEQSLKTLKNDGSITVNDLRREIQKVIHPIYDAHTTSYHLYPNDRYLRTIAEMTNKGYSVISVNEMDSRALKELVKPYYSYETESWISLDVGALSSLDLYGISSPYTFVWQHENGDTVTHVYTDDDFVSIDEYYKLNEQYNNDHGEDNSFVSYRIDEECDVAVLTLTECNLNDYYVNCLREMFTDIKTKSIRNVAVDVRGNGGGYSGVVNEFVKYLNVDTYSDVSCDMRFGFMQFHQDNVIKNRKYSDLLYDGNVYILTDSDTFSSAMMFAEIIQDNKLGKVIGRSPANNCNGYGDVVTFRLPNTGLAFSCSRKKWCRIDAESKSDYVIPDYECYSDEVMETLYGLLQK